MSVRDKIESQLKEKGYANVYDGPTGFTYVKKYGLGAMTVSYTSVNDMVSIFDHEIKSYDGNGYVSAPLSSDDLLLFYKRIREWKKFYGEV